MKKYKYELVPVLQPNMAGYNGMLIQIKNLGYNGFELKAVENGLAFFAKTIDIPERDEKKDDNMVENNVPMRPVDDKLWIEQLLLKHKYNRRTAAKEYGVTERTFYRKLSEYGLTKNQKVDQMSFNISRG